MNLDAVGSDVISAANKIVGDGDESVCRLSDYDRGTKTASMERSN